MICEGTTQEIMKDEDAKQTGVWLCSLSDVAVRVLPRVHRPHLTFLLPSVYSRCAFPAAQSSIQPHMTLLTSGVRCVT